MPIRRVAHLAPPPPLRFGWCKHGATRRPRTRKPQRCFDVRIRVDGFAFRRSFDQRGWADDYVRGLHEGFAGGWPFDDHDARRFLPADAATVDEEAVTFFMHARDFVERKWVDWAPASRRNSQRELARAVIDLVDDDAPVLTADDRVRMPRVVWNFGEWPPCCGAS